MAEARPFPFTACVDHTNLTFEEFMTWSAPANCNFKPEKHAIVFRKLANLSPAINFRPDKYFYAYREFVTLSATTCNFKSEKSLEERQADVARIREKHPDLLPVIILKAEESKNYYPKKKKTLIPANRNLGEFFVAIWKTFYEFEIMSKTYSLISIVEHKDPIFEKLMSSVYEEYKDEDGCLYITLSGEMKDVLPEPIPSNIKTWTFHV